MSLTAGSHQLVDLLSSVAQTLDLLVNGVPQDAVPPEVYFPAVAVASCILLFGFILVYILRVGTSVRRPSSTTPEKFSGFFDQSDVGIGVVDAKGFMVQSNESMQHLTGYSATELSTIGFRSLFADKNDYVEPSKVAGMLDRFGESHQVFLRHRSGNLVRIRFLVLPAPDAVLEDAQVLLIEAASGDDGGRGGEKPEEGDALHDARDSFLASLNHELKTPLTVILGNASLLAEEERYSPELVSAILASGKRLLNELEGLLLLADASTSTDEMKSAPAELHTIVGGVVSDYKRQVTELGVDVDSTGLQAVAGDVDHIAFHRLVSLVIDFALHRSAGGTMSVSLAQAGHLVTLTVGMPVVARTSKLQASTSPNHDSGLAIASRLAEELGGVVTLHESANGQPVVLDATIPVHSSLESEIPVPVGRAA